MQGLLNSDLIDNERKINMSIEILKTKTDYKIED